MFGLTSNIKNAAQQPQIVPFSPPPPPTFSTLLTKPASWDKKIKVSGDQWHVKAAATRSCFQTVGLINSTPGGYCCFVLLKVPLTTLRWWLMGFSKRLPKALKTLPWLMSHRLCLCQCISLNTVRHYTSSYRFLRIRPSDEILLCLRPLGFVASVYFWLGAASSVACPCVEPFSCLPPP